MGHVEQAFVFPFGFSCRLSYAAAYRPALLRAFSGTVADED